MRRILKLSFVALAMLTVPAVLTFCAVYFSPGGRREAIPWYGELGFVLWDWYALAPALPLMFWLVRRFRFDKEHWITSTIVQVLTCVVFVAIYTGHAVFYFQYYYGPTNPALRSSVPYVERYMGVIGRVFPYYMVDYCALTALILALTYYQQFRDRERAAAELQVKTSQLEANLAQARFEALTLQLHPHFLFNTLNTIAALVRQDEKRTAIRMIAGFSDLLRRTLDESDLREAPLSQEIEFIRTYLSIEQVRFHDRLNVHISIEPGVQEALVPYLVLLPLVENAIRHGIAERAAASIVAVKAWRDEMLNIQVDDDGPGVGDGAALREGIGIRNTRERLAQQFGGGHEFSLANRPEGGARAFIRIPFREAGRADPCLVMDAKSAR